MKKLGGLEVWLHIFLISALDRGEWLASRLGRFTVVERSQAPIGQQGEVLILFLVYLFVVLQLGIPTEHGRCFLNILLFFQC